MKIRSITLDNVRRFTDPVTVGPIGDGITLLCEPNESGKSTLFDALHALFFVKYSAWRAEVASLQPHSGGKVIVGVTLEAEGAQWRIRKQWQKGAGGEVRVWQNGQLRFQGDDAEHWLSTLVRGDGPGPSGLLWVRQGRVKLSVDGQYAKQDEKGEEHEQRRDLLTLITGAMDDLTGGKTMDTARDTVLAELGALQTSTGKAKTGGAWAKAVAEVEGLQTREAQLAQQAEELHSALDERRRLNMQLAELDDPEMQASRAANLTQAETAFKEAERHATQIQSARTEASLARHTYDAARAEADRAQTLRNELAEAQQHATLATEATLRTEAKLAEAEGTWTLTHTVLKTAEQADTDARAMAQRVTRRDAALAASAQRHRLAEALKKAEAAQIRAATALAEAERGPTDAQVRQIEDLARRLDTARAVRDAAGPTLSLRYHPGAAQVQIDGQPMLDGVAHVVTGRATLEVPGIGALTITPQEDDSDEPVRRAEQAVAGALGAVGWADVITLRQAARARSDALQTAHQAEQTRDAHAPDGLQALRNELARLPEAPQTDASPLPDAIMAEAEATRAAAGLTAAREAEVAARIRRDTAKGNATAARATAQAAAERLERAQRALATVPEQDQAGIAERLDALRKAAQDAETCLLTRQQAAPNIKAAEARLTRVRQVVEVSREQSQQIRLRLASLGAVIEARAEEGVEEALEDARQRLTAARAQLDRVLFEVDVLRRLSEALHAAQSAAREQYYAPIARELRPLLEELWDDAELVWSDDTLLPVEMIRRGETERIDTLSGGTQEQIAFLVRLAFAQLLAKSGRHAPLILDDALVYSDDDRIERLFNALHGAAGELQILVLSCRQRAFRDLGAPQVSFLPAPRDAT